MIKLIIRCQVKFSISSLMTDRTNHHFIYAFSEGKKQKTTNYENKELICKDPNEF